MHSFDEDDHVDDEDIEHAADEDSTAALVWQLLLLINPGDEEAALQQFAAWQELAEPEAAEPVLQVARVIDWRSGFMVAAEDPHALIQAIDELAARWNLSIDWGGDPEDDGFFDERDVPALFGVAYDRLAEDGYTLWAWETDDDSYAGWITLTRDAEPLREVVTALGINLRLGSEVT